MRDETEASAAFALTEAQEGLFYFQSLDPKNPILNTGQYLDLRGGIDWVALRAALRLTLAESDALRLRFAMGANGPEQWLGPEPAFEEIDLADAAEAEAEARRLMAEDSARPLDLAHDPAARFILFRLSDDRALIYERIHHLAIDGYGMVLVTNRIGEHYDHLTGQGPAPLAFPPLSRAADEDSAYRHSPRRDSDAAWWREALKTMPEVTSPGTLQGERAVSGSTFLRHGRWLPEALAKALEAKAAALNIGWPDVLTALTGAYLARWSQGEAVIGLPFMARMGRKIARLPCMAMNVLPARIRPDEERPLAEWLAQCCADLREARKYGLYRSEQLRRDLGLIGGSRRLYGALVNVQPFDRPPAFAGLSVTLHILSAGAVDDLTFTFRGDPQAGILFETDANPALYAKAAIKAHAERLIAFLEAALDAETLAEVPTASADEIRAQQAAEAASRRDLPDTTLVAMVAAQMARTPEAKALTYGETTLTYGEVDRRVTALAQALRARGIGPESLVAVSLERGLDLPIALLAIQRAGAGYLPLDPEHPPERLARILQMAGPKLLIASPEQAALFPHHTEILLPEDWPQSPDPALPALPEVRPQSLAYVIYTSGSTGEPKGVMIEHRAIVNRLWWMRDFYGIGAGDRILQKTPATFDVSVWEFFLPFLSGAELVMAPPQAHRDPAALAALIRKHAITTLHFVPSMLSAFLAAPASEGLSIRRTFCSGEELTADQRDRFHRRINGELHNLYGPTEAAVDVSYWDAAPSDRSNPLPIGFPVWNTALVILDDRQRPVPVGLPGHLYLGGVQLARGYLGRPDLTAERFLPDPRQDAELGSRLYATGDLARLREDGAVVYLGRSDHQVKIRGLRIELGEIEAAIQQTGLAREAVVLAREDHAGEKRLVAYLVPESGYQAGLLAPRLATRLPAYMIPSAEVALEALPVTSNGKLDRKALPAPSFAAEGRAASRPAERLLARLYQEVLHLDSPAPLEADFFSLGGDSLSAVRLTQRIEEETGRDPGLGQIFEHPQLELLAQVIEAGGETDDGLGPMIRLGDGDPALAPLFLIHPAGGLGWGYRSLARKIAPKRRIFALQHPALDPSLPLPANLAALAKDYARKISTAQPEGILHLAGWSVGGILAQEIAVELSAMGREIGLVALFDAYPTDVWRNEPEPDPVAALRALLAIAGYDPEAHRDLDSREKVVAFLRRGQSALGALPPAVLDGVVRLVTDTNRLVRSHEHRFYSGKLTHIRAGRDHAGRDLTAHLWQSYAAEVEMLEIPFLHAEMISPAASTQIALLLTTRIG